MKNYIVGICLILGATFTGISQEFSYGLRGGINYTMGGQITGISSNGLYNDDTFEGTGGIGFQGGIFVQVNFGNFFVRPELVYSTLENEFDFPIEPSSYSVERFAIPFMIGYNVFGPLDIYAGPVYSNILNATLEGEEFLNPIVVQNTPVNAQVGAKIEFGRFGIDIRYEHSLSTPETLELDIVNDDYGVNRATFDDATIDQIIVSLILKLGGPGLNEGRGRPCY